MTRTPRATGRRSSRQAAHAAALLPRQTRSRRTVLAAVVAAALGVSAFAAGALHAVGATHRSASHEAAVRTESPAMVTVSDVVAAAGTRGTLRTWAGSYWISRSHATLANTHITGNLYVTGSHVSVLNVKVDGVVYINQSPRGGLASPVPSFLVFRHLDAHTIYANGFANLTLDNLNLHDTLDAPHMQLFNYFDPRTRVRYPATNLALENSWIHGVRPSTNGGHLENVHVAGIQKAVIRNNIFDIRPASAATLNLVTANFVMESSMYGVWNSRFAITGNWFHGGGYYQVYIDATGSSSVTYNHFYSDGAHFAGVQFPPSWYVRAALPGGRYVKFSQAGNTLNGRAVRLPGGR